MASKQKGNAPLWQIDLKIMSPVRLLSILKFAIAEFWKSKCIETSPPMLALTECPRPTPEGGALVSVVAPNQEVIPQASDVVHRQDESLLLTLAEVEDVSHIGSELCREKVGVLLQRGLVSLD